MEHDTPTSIDLTERELLLDALRALDDALCSHSGDMRRTLDAFNAAYNLALRLPSTCTEAHEPAAARQRALLDGMRAIARSRDCHPSIQHQWNAAMGDALAAYLAAGGKLEG